MSGITQKILIVDDETHMRESLCEILTDCGYECDTACDGMQALQLVQSNKYSLVISDIKMPRLHGMALLDTVKENDPNCPLLLMTAFATVSQAVQAIKAGAEDYITKPFDPDELITMIETIISRNHSCTEENISTGIFQNSGERKIIGESRNMHEVYSLIQTVAPTDANILIEGESGTGKELVADALHKLSTRSDKPFVKVNCAAIPGNLLESELFGHVKGAFTGAIKDKKGTFELAHGGTLYLDEIGDMDIALQAKILRVLQEKEFAPVGSEHIKKADVRIIAATNKDLKQAMDDDEFREDLYYRLNVINIALPPLRERRDDIVLLIDHFIKSANIRFNKSIVGVTQTAFDYLQRYDWPGNIRELQNSIERAAILTQGNHIDIEHLPAQINTTQSIINDTDKNVNFKNAKTHFERSLLEDALRETNGSVSKAARLLGISRHSFRYQMEKYGLKKINA